MIVPQARWLLALLHSLSSVPAERAGAPHAQIHFLSCCPGDCESLWPTGGPYSEQDIPEAGPSPWKSHECASHSECPSGGYCYSWARCAEISRRLSPLASEEQMCLEFTPYGHCSPSYMCSQSNDSIDGSCPASRFNDFCEGSQDLPRCERWAGEGRCTDPLTKGFMRVNCPEACGSCTSGESFSRGSTSADPWTRQRSGELDESPSRRRESSSHWSQPSRQRESSSDWASNSDDSWRRPRTGVPPLVGQAAATANLDVEPQLVREVGPWVAWLESLRWRLQFGLRPALGVKTTAGVVKVPRGLKQRCGRVAVPWSKEGPASQREGLKTMPLFFRLITLNTSSSKSEEQDPMSELTELVVMQQGGPGAGGEALVELLHPERQQSLWHQHAGHRLGVILPDHRGVGFSAKLQCRGPSGSILQSFAANTQGYEGFSLESMLKIARKDVSRCVDHLSPFSEMLPDDVSTTAAARDLHALIRSVRSSIGTSSIHLYGVSYGTYVVQRFMDLFPHGADSFIIDGVVPARGFTFRDWDTYPNLVGHSLIRLCAQDTVCNGFFNFASPETAVSELQHRIYGLATSPTKCASTMRRFTDFARTVSPELFAPQDAPWTRNVGEYSQLSTMVRTLGAIAVSAGRFSIPRSKLCTAMVEAGFAESNKTCGIADLRVSYLSWLHRFLRCDPDLGDVDYMTLPFMWAAALSQMSHGNQDMQGIDAFVYNTIKFSELWDVDEPLAWKEATIEGTWQQPDFFEPPEVPLGVTAAAGRDIPHARSMISEHNKIVRKWKQLKRFSSEEDLWERRVVQNLDGSLALQFDAQKMQEKNPLMNSSLGKGWWYVERDGSARNDRGPFRDYHRLAGLDVLLRSSQMDLRHLSPYEIEDAIQVKMSHTHALFRKGSEKHQQLLLREQLATWQSQIWNRSLFGTCDFPASDTLSMVWPRYPRDLHVQRWPESEASKDTPLPRLLVLTGGLDAHTPEYLAHWAVGNLTWQATHLIVPGGGHGAIMERCGASAFGAFLAGSKTLESDFQTCVDAEPVVNFAPGVMDAMMLGKHGHSLWEDSMCTFDADKQLPPAPEADLWSLVPDFLGAQGEEEEDPLKEPSAKELRCGSWRLRCAGCITSCLMQQLTDISVEESDRLTEFVLTIKDKVSQEGMSYKRKAFILGQQILKMHPKDQNLFADAFCGCIDVITDCIEPLSARCEKSTALGDQWASQFLPMFGSTVKALTLKGTLCSSPSLSPAAHAPGKTKTQVSTKEGKLDTKTESPRTKTSKAPTKAAPSPTPMTLVSAKIDETGDLQVSTSVLLGVLASIGVLACMVLVFIIFLCCSRHQKYGRGTVEDAVDTGTLLEDMAPAVDYTGFTTPRGRGDREGV